MHQKLPDFDLFLNCGVEKLNTAIYWNF